MTEQYEDTVILKKLDGEAMGLVIEYMYVGNITISQDNVFNLLTTAKFLQMEEVCQFCFDFLEEIISIENWDTMLSTLHLYENDSLLKKVHQFISKNFDKIAETNRFRDFEIQDMISFFQIVNRSLIMEKSIYTAIRSWISHDKPNRKSAFRDLLLLIDLQKLPSDFLEDVVATDPLVTENVDCINAVTSAITKQFKEIRQKECGSKLISVGGFANPRKVMVIRNFFDTAKTVYPDLPNLQYHSKALLLNGYIYNIGGSLKIKISNHAEITNKVHRMNICDSEMKWEKVSSMNERRCMMGAAVFKDFLVVAGGGKDVGRFHDKEEFYNPPLNKWKQFAKLNQERVFNQLVSCDGCLFAIGGNDGNQPLSLMEMLSDLNGTWEVVEAMNEPRAWFAAVNCQGQIYAIGGMNETSDGRKITLKSVEKYNPVKKRWTYVSDMKTERCEHAACVLRGKIFVVGGTNASNETVKTIECYDPATDKWTESRETKEKLVFHSLIAI